ncbi:MAG: hypothetical protein P8K77_03725 [Polaribacter sp.]|nr:hypothetical protein [Polaribacter sp.]
MKLTIVIKNLLLLIIFVSILNDGYSQKKLFEGWEIISVQKDTVFLLFRKNNGNHPKHRCIKFKNKKGIVFNLCKNGSLLFPNKFKADTLCYKHLKDYTVSTIEDIEKKVKDFRYKTYKKRPKSDHAKLYQAYDNNDIFQTYLIEIISNKKFVIYPVIWRNQRIMQ